MFYKKGLCKNIYQQERNLKHSIKLTHDQSYWGIRTKQDPRYGQKESVQ